VLKRALQWSEMRKNGVKAVGGKFH
jgi:hypothetical protein